MTMNKLSGSGVSTEVTFEQRSERRKGKSHNNVWEQGAPDKRTTSAELLKQEYEGCVS